MGKRTVLPAKPMSVKNAPRPQAATTRKQRHADVQEATREAAKRRARKAARTMKAAERGAPGRPARTAPAVRKP